MAEPHIKFSDVQGLNHSLRLELGAAFQEVLAQGDFIKGKALRQFESELARYLGKNQQAVGVGNGTSALFLALKALDLPPESPVLMPSFNYVASAEAAALAGLQPRFCDVEPASQLMTIEDLEKAHTPECRAVVAVHLYGQGKQLATLRNWCQEKGLYLIEDVAQALGAEEEGRKLGTFGHLSTFSFFPTKNLGALGDGGAVASANPDLLDRVRQLAQHGQAEKYRFAEVGVNSRLDTLQAALLSVKLQFLEQHNEQRRQAAARYDQALCDLEGLALPERVQAGKHVFHQYTIRCKNRQGLKLHLKQKGIPTVVYYPLALHQQPAYHHWAPAEGLPKAEQLAGEVLSLPMHPLLGEEAQHYITESIAAFFSDKR